MKEWNIFKFPTFSNEVSSNEANFKFDLFLKGISRILKKPRQIYMFSCLFIKLINI